MIHLHSAKIHSLLSSSPSSSRPLLLLLLRLGEASKRGSHSLSRRHYEESRNVRVSVWWDFENCNVPLGTNVFRVVHTITAAIRANGIKGPVEITAFGDMLQLSRAKQEGLSATGINLTHIPRGGKNSADRSLLLSLMFWVSQNPPPAHLLLISSDSDFASTLHRLRMNNYNILLATTTSAPGVLCSAASIMWNWHDLLRGENLTGKYFNQPPDGPYGSWYGHYNVPLLDPFSDEQRLQTEESSAPNSDDKPRPIPKAVIKQIRKILEANPRGISITEFRNELVRTLNLDREYYGYKRFVPFLSSLENILKLRQVSDGHYIVTQSSPVDFEDSPGLSNGPSSNEEDADVSAPSDLSCDKLSIKEPADRETSLPPRILETLLSSPPSDVSGKDRFGNADKASALDENMTKMVNTTDGHLPPRDANVVETVMGDENIVRTVNSPDSGNHFPPVDERIVETVNAPESESPDPVVVENESSSKAGLFRKFWRKWFGSKSLGSHKKSFEDEGKCRGKDVEKDSKSTVSFVDSVLPSSHSLSLSESTLENRICTNSEAFLDKPVIKPGLLDQIQNWCKFFKSTSDSDKLSSCSSDGLNPIIRDDRHELFLNDSFWSSVESFLNTSEGLLLVSESTTREQMAHNFQSKGPSCLQSLGENGLLCLVDLLIAEKKWVEECPSEVFPFKLTRVGQSLSSESHHGLNGLSSIFSASSSQSDMKRLANHHGEGKSLNVYPVTKEKVQLRSRDEVLADCQNLVNDILKEHPEGFFVGLFRKHFLARYGYHLDLHKLGFPKLASLLRTMSGLKIESGYMIPCDNDQSTTSVENTYPYDQEDVSHTAALDTQLSDAPKNSDGLDSLWEELGPVASTKSVEKQTDFHYEPAISDDEFSDSVETSPISQADEQMKTRMEESSSLLQILDSWHAQKGGDSCKDQSSNSDMVTDTAKLCSSLSLADKMSEMSSRMQGRKQRPRKTYSFVSDSGDNNDELVNGIFGNLSKPTNESSKNAKAKVLCE